jgi:hypothetical protein
MFEPTTLGIEMNKTDTIQDLWARYSELCGLQHLPSNEQTELMRSFYGGFVACLGVTMEICKDTDDEEEPDEAASMIDKLHNEGTEFFSNPPESFDMVGDSTKNLH